MRQRRATTTKSIELRCPLLKSRRHVPVVVVEMIVAESFSYELVTHIRKVAQNSDAEMFLLQ